jgi:hypothetical protein
MNIVLKRNIFIATFLLFQFVCFAQNQPKQLEAIRITTTPKINGVLDEEIWKNAPVAGNFIQFEPRNGQPSSFKTEVHVVYDDNALYVGAFLFDTLPAGIYKQFGERDDDNLNADYFTLYQPFL